MPTHIKLEGSSEKLSYLVADLGRGRNVVAEDSLRRRGYNKAFPYYLFLFLHPPTRAARQRSWCRRLAGRKGLL
jgi:hypothetical protein